MCMREIYENFLFEIIGVFVNDKISGKEEKEREKVI